MHAVLGGLLRALRIGDPDASAAGAAAERVVAIARHLDQLAADQLQHLARRVVAAVQAPEMARVMERDALVERLFDFEPAAGQKVGEHARIVLDRRDLAEGRVFVLDRVVAVRVGGDDALERLGALHLLDVVAREFLVKALFADAAHVVARRLLALVQQREVFACGLEEPRHRLADLLVARIEGGEVADEPQRRGGILADVLDAELERLRPLRALARVLAEAVAGVADLHDRVAQQGVHRALLDEMPAHAHDEGRMFDADRADLLAGAAGAAGPERLRRDDAADEIERR